MNTSARASRCRRRLNIYIEPDHAKALKEVAAGQGVSKSAVVAAALASFLSLDAAKQREAAVVQRLDQLSRQFDRLERDQTVLIEALALFVRHFLTVSVPVPEGQQDAARAQGHARYGQFVEQLGRHLLRGRSLVHEIHDEISPRSLNGFPVNGRSRDNHGSPMSDGRDALACQTAPAEQNTGEVSHGEQF